MTLKRLGPRLTPRSSGFAALALLLAAGFAYVAGLATGAFTLIGYEAQTKSQRGATSTRTGWATRFGVPVWLAEGRAIQADFDVDARFGAVLLRVAPPLPLRTSLQSAVAYVEGKRAGSVTFVAEAAGWYTFEADPTPLGGPRCGKPELDARRMLIGDPDCPIYDVSYQVTWRLAGDGAASRGAPRLSIPRPHGKLATLRIGG